MSERNQSVITQFQQEVVDIMKADEVLSSACTFLPENIKDIEFQIKQALGKQGLVAVVLTPNLAYRGRDAEVTWWDVVDGEIDITENPVVNRGSKTGDFFSAQDIACRCAQVLGQPDLSHAGDFALKQVETGEFEGLLLCKLTFDAFLCIPAA